MTRMITFHFVLWRTMDATTIPEGKKGGVVMQVHTPSGEVLEVLIPVGLLAGQSFIFDLPGGKQPGSLETFYKNQIQTAGAMAAEKRKSEYIQGHNLDVADVGHKAAEDVMARRDQQQQRQDLWLAKQKEAQKLMDTLKAEDSKKEAAEEEAKEEAGAEAVEVAAERKDLLESALKIIYAQEAKKAALEQEAQHLATLQALALNPKP